MKDVIKRLVKEALEIENKSISRSYMMGLLKNVHNNLAKKYLKSWIKRGASDMVELSPREYNLLKLIQQGGVLPQQFHSKN
jgi:hypothetical protein